MALENGARASDLLIFFVDGNRFGLTALDVVELTLAVAVAPLPRQASEDHKTQDAKSDTVQTDKNAVLFQGIVDFHGELAVVVGLGSRFGLPSKPLSVNEHFIFARVGKSLVALRCDHVDEMVQAGVEDLDTIVDLMAQKNNRNNSPNYTNPIYAGQAGKIAAATAASGVARLTGGLVYIFDLQTLLSAGESEALSDLLAEARRSKGD